MEDLIDRLRDDATVLKFRGRMFRFDGRKIRSNNEFARDIETLIKAYEDLTK